MSQLTALISVSDKTGLVEFAKGLAAQGVNLISTGGTAKHLRDAGLEVQDISDLTQFPEILDGRVKTLHPAVHGGILARRDLPEHMETIEKHGFRPIDFIVVNLYPFVRTAEDPSKSFEDVVEQIDIGGPSMLRSAAKNHAAVTVVTDPADYGRVLAELKEDGKTSQALRSELAAKVYMHTSAYDAAIANYLGSKIRKAEEDVKGEWPQVFSLSMPLAQTMRYGENPHQGAAFYRDPSCDETSLGNSKQLHGKELSYNNILDAEGALEMVRDFADLDQAATVIVKHSNPCGIAIGDTLSKSYAAARACDPDSAFGGIIALSVAVDVETANQINETFNEIVIAPSYEPGALEVLQKKKNLRILETGKFTAKKSQRIPRGVVGGVLVMDRDLGAIGLDELKVVSEAKPNEEDLRGLLFAWRSVKWIKSNAIVYTSHKATLGIGAGQMSRVDAARLGITKARQDLKGSFMASDAFFPFRDCVDIAAEVGVKAVIQPGGSIRDEDSINAANEHGIALVFTGMRHFRH